MDKLHYHGREIPITMIDGYFQGWREVLGRCSVPATLVFQARELVPDSEEQMVWLKPIDRYVGRPDAPNEPVDYVYVAMMYWGLISLYKIPPVKVAQYPLSIRSFKVVAQYWWWGGSYVWPDHFLSLRALCEPAFNKWVTALYAAVGAHMSLTQISCLSFRQLMQIFGQISGIPYQCTILAQQIVVKIIECPCCLSQPQDCWFFVELIDNMLAWLFGKYQAVPTTACLELDREASLGHTIVIQIVGQD